MNLGLLFGRLQNQTKNLTNACGRVETETNPTGSLKSFKSKWTILGINPLESTVTFVSKNDSTILTTFKYGFEFTSRTPDHSKFTASLI